MRTVVPLFIDSTAASAIRSASRPSVHVLNLSEEDALKLLMHDAFQTETEARGKWRRVQLSSVQLTSYFAGFSEIYEFREQQKEALGSKFNLRDFHTYP